MTSTSVRLNVQPQLRHTKKSNYKTDLQVVLEDFQIDPFVFPEV